MSISTTQENKVSKNGRDLITELQLAEYVGLRNEIQKRAEFMQQRESLAVTIWGAILTLGVSDVIAGPLIGYIVGPLLLYPWIAFFLSAGWFYNFKRIDQIGRYLNTLEEKLGYKEDGIQWEHWLQNDLNTNNKIANRKSFRIFEFIGSGGVFVGTQVVTLIITFVVSLRMVNDFVWWCLFVFAVLITVLTVVLFRKNIFSK